MNDGVTSKMAPMVVYRARRLCLREGLDSANATNAPTDRWSPQMMVLTACISTAMFGNGQPFSWQEAPVTSNSLFKDETQQMI